MDTIERDTRLSLTDEPLEQLELRIWQGAANLAAAECDWLLAVAEFDRREAWVHWECTSCAAWLSWQVGLDMRTAHEKVRVARALVTNPLIRATMSSDQLSYAKVRAISRIVAPDTEEMLVGLALSSTASQVERFVTAYRRSEESTVEAAARQHSRRRLTHHLEPDGSITIVARLPAADAMRVLAVIDSGLAPATDDDGQHVPIDQRRADALVDAVCGGDAACELVHVHVDAAVLAGHGTDGIGDAGTEDGSIGVDDSTWGASLGRCDVEPIGDTGASPAPLTADAVWRLLCDGPYLGVVHGPDAQVAGLTPRQRLVRGARRKEVELRDGGCRFPGCTRRGRIEIHHIVHRHHGGNSELPNLLSLCRFHHHRVHEGGWQLVGIAGDGIVAVAPNGRRLTMRPVQPLADPGAVERYDRSADDGRSQWQGDRLDVGLVTELFHRQHDHPRRDGPASPPAQPPAA